MFTAIFQGAVAAALAAGATDVESVKSRVDVLGLQVCIEEPNDGRPCHIRLFRSEKPVEQDAVTPMQMTFFGKTICVGSVPVGVACDFRLPSESTDPVPA
jgi:hypothetical protein